MGKGKVIKFACFFWIFSFCVQEAIALRNMKIKVPKAVRNGQSVVLSCEYDLEAAALYTVKWFRNEVEFYRYVPKESPPYQTFKLPHLEVDVSTSNWINVTLLHVGRETSGEFKCEVTADAPLFQTEMRASLLIVADIPDEGPELKTDISKIAPGSDIKANCTSPGSFPKANITWFLNDLEIRPTIGFFAENTFSHKNPVSNLFSTVSTISLRANPASFRNGKIKLRCVATIFDMYSHSQEIELLEDAPQVALIMIPLDRNSGRCFFNGCFLHLKWILAISFLSSLIQHQKYINELSM